MIFIIAFLSAYFMMEFNAWAAHKFLMHGLLWKIHKDHHQPTGKPFQKNDLFFLIFAIPSWLLIMFGFINGWVFMYGFGFGIAAYGLTYFLVHDVLVHRRFKWFDNTTNKYFKSVQDAHRVHHQYRDKEDGECFGLLIFPSKHMRK